MTPTDASRVLSGITPSGPLTLGNYLGALKRFVDGQGSQQGYFFIADLHALTTPSVHGRVRELTLQTSALYFAAGLDPEPSTVFVQSHVRAHVDLAYLLESTAYVGELGRMIQFKEKGGRPRTRASLFTYPGNPDPLSFGEDGDRGGGQLRGARDHLPGPCRSHRLRDRGRPRRGRLVARDALAGHALRELARGSPR